MSLINENDHFPIEKLNEKLNFFLKFCDENLNDENISLKKSCETIYEIVQEVYKIAYEYTFENIPSNGFIIYLIFVDKFFEKANEKIKKLKHTNFRFFKLFETILNYSQNINFKLLSKDDNAKLNDQQISLHFDFVETQNFYDMYNHKDECIKLLYGPYVGFWLEKSVKNCLILLSKLRTCEKNFLFSINCLWNSQKRGKLSFYTIKKCSLRYPFDDWHIVNKVWYKLFLKSYFLIFRNVKFRKINVPRQKRFKIYYKSNIIDLKKGPKEEINNFLNDEEVLKRENSLKIRHKNLNTIECAFYSMNSLKKNSVFIDKEKNYKVCTTTRNEKLSLNTNKPLDIEKKLVLNIHGGGFFIRTPDELLLRYFTSKLKGIPILSINYSLTMPYPVSLQEILDVYLWLISGDQEIIDKIGFHPEKIILMCDSAGGLLGLQLILFLNELNKKLKKFDEKIVLPNAYFGLYPCFNFFDFTPSKLVTTYDTMIPLHAVLLMGSKFLSNKSTGKDFDETEIDKNNSLKNKPWFDCEYTTFKKRMSNLNTVYNDMYINVLKYDDYESLKNISMDITVGQFDIFLDDCIEFSKIWKGKITLNILKGMFHGFHYLFKFSSDLKEATDFCCERLQTLCDLT